jgi:hypothetical protein
VVAKVFWRKMQSNEGWEVVFPNTIANGKSWRRKYGPLAKDSADCTLGVVSQQITLYLQHSDVRMLARLIAAVMLYAAVVQSEGSAAVKRVCLLL